MGRWITPVIAATLVAAACTSAPVTSGDEWDPDGEITTPIQSIPEQMDPNRAGFIEQVRHLAMMFEPLMTFDPTTLEPIPAAARDRPKVSADGLTYTFTVREGAMYSDGSPVRAKDFAYAFSRVCDHALGPPGATARLIAGCAALREMDPTKTAPHDLAAARERLGLRANSDTEFVVTLTEPLAYFMSLTATPLAYPAREADVARGAASYGREAATLVGNGPFKLVEWTPG